MEKVLLVTQDGSKVAMVRCASSLANQIKREFDSHIANVTPDLRFTCHIHDPLYVTSGEELARTCMDLLALKTKS